MAKRHKNKSLRPVFRDEDLDHFIQELERGCPLPSAQTLAEFLDSLRYHLKRLRAQLQQSRDVNSALRSSKGPLTSGGIALPTAADWPEPLVEGEPSLPKTPRAEPSLPKTPRAKKRAYFPLPPAPSVTTPTSPASFTTKFIEPSPNAVPVELVFRGLLKTILDSSRGKTLVEVFGEAVVLSSLPGVPDEEFDHLNNLQGFQSMLSTLSLDHLCSCIEIHYNGLGEVKIIVLGADQGAVSSQHHTKKLIKDASYVHRITVMSIDFQ